MTRKSSQKTEDNDSISISDALLLQDDLKRELDFDKPDDQLEPIDHALKALYMSLDEAIEKGIGKETKKKIDENKKLLESLTKLKNDIYKVTELGKEIEKSLVLQAAYLSNYFQKDEDNYYFEITNKLDSYAMNESTSVDERVAAAQKCLEIIKVYETEVMGGLRAKQEISEALLNSFEMNVKEMDFALLNDEKENTEMEKSMKTQYLEWLSLTKELLKNRKKASAAIQEGIDIDRLIPKLIIDSNGDLSRKMSSFEIKGKGERMVRWTSEASETEEKIEQKRSKISTNLFGNPDEYMDFENKGDSSEKEVRSHNPLEDKAWFRFLKVVYYVLWVVGLSVVTLLSYASGEFGVFIVGVLIVWGIMTIVEKAFFYIALGNK